MMDDMIVFFVSITFFLLMLKLYHLNKKIIPGYAGGFSIAYDVYLLLMSLSLLFTYKDIRTAVRLLVGLLGHIVKL